jgi:hypothetical protein
LRDLMAGAGYVIANRTLVTTRIHSPAMATKWIDSTEYFGPDRRRRPAKRWNDRRRFNEAADIPPLGALLRRLRVQMVSLTPEGCSLVLQMLGGAISEANRQGLPECAAALYAADAALRKSGVSAAAKADGLLLQAMAAVGDGR